MTIEHDVSEIKKSNAQQEADLRAMYCLANKIKRTTDKLSPSMRKRAREILVLDHNYISAANRRLKTADTEIRAILVNNINICLKVYY